MTTKPEPQTLYFAYGSNLSLTQMSSRCPNSKFHSIALLHGWDFAISPRGYANIVPVEATQAPTAARTTSTREPEDSGDVEDSSQAVWGVVYQLSAADEAALDVHEGVPWAYEKRVLEVGVRVQVGTGILLAPVLLPALVYVDLRGGGGVPRSEYVVRMDRALRDARRAGVPERYVKELRRWFPEGGGETECE